MELLNKQLLNKHQAKHVTALSQSLKEQKKAPMFTAGDTIAVHIKVREGQRERIQIFEGVCLARRNRGVGSSFLVRKISYGEGVERTFPLYSPSIARIKVLKKGKVRRAKLYYLRQLSGKKARIASTIASSEDVIEVAQPEPPKEGNPKEGKQAEKPEAEAKSDAKPEVKQEAKSEAKQEAKSEAKGEATPEVKSDAKPEATPPQDHKNANS